MGCSPESVICVPEAWGLEPEVCGLPPSRLTSRLLLVTVALRPLVFKSLEEKSLVADHVIIVKPLLFPFSLPLRRLPPTAKRRLLLASASQISLSSSENFLLSHTHHPYTHHPVDPCAIFGYHQAIFQTQLPYLETTDEGAFRRRKSGHVAADIS